MSVFVSMIVFKFRFTFFFFGKCKCLCTSDIIFNEWLRFQKGGLIFQASPLNLTNLNWHVATLQCKKRKGLKLKDKKILLSMALLLGTKYIYFIS